MCILKWHNKFSGEEGFVKSVSKAKGYFINTYNSNEAKKYNGPKQIDNDIDFLRTIGELNNNDFELVQV